MDERITSFSINENMINVGDLNSQNVQKFAYGRFEAKMGIECTVSNGYWWDLVLGNATNGGAGPFTHTYDDNKTVNAITAELGIDTTTDRVPQLQMGTVNDVTVTSTLDEVVKARFNLQFGAASATAESSLDASIATDSINSPMTLVHATVENPS